MIKTETDFTSVLSELTADTPALKASFSTRMSSSEYNAVSEAIEKELNAIYEQLRLMEDVKNYTREFLLKEIQEKKELFQKKLQTIEEASDVFQDTSFVTFQMPMESRETAVKDRDGSDLAVMLLQDGGLESTGNAPARASIQTVTRKSDYACHHSSEQNLINGRPSRSLYRLYEPAKDGVTETYKLEFRTPVQCNFLDIHAVNAKAEDIKGITPDGSAVEIAEPKSYISTETFSGLEFTLRASDFKIGKISDAPVEEPGVGDMDGSAYRRRESESQIHDMISSTKSDLERRYQTSFRADHKAWEENVKEIGYRNGRIEKGE